MIDTKIRALYYLMLKNEYDDSGQLWFRWPDDEDAIKEIVCRSNSVMNYPIKISYIISQIVKEICE